uniref:Uncharacterized protein n=1 Tax=Rhizophagus irregularis (strain DAOM 181602 / DAOM 197198 / MUCL 43194) TaxID=747089 RepID=U9V323_RHIID
MTSDDDTGTIRSTPSTPSTSRRRIDITRSGNTSNLIAHLRDKHGIIKENYTEYLDVNNEPKVVQTSNRPSTCSPERQELLSRMLMKFIIHFCNSYSPNNRPMDIKIST